jgi:plastocyanin
VTIAVGDTVRWVWRGKAVHNVSVLRGPVRFTSPFKRRGTFRRTLTSTAPSTAIRTSGCASSCADGDCYSNRGSDAQTS